jgi:hypothetical protein
VSSAMRLPATGPDQPGDMSTNRLHIDEPVTWEPAVRLLTTSPGPVPPRRRSARPTLGARPGGGLTRSAIATHPNTSTSPLSVTHSPGRDDTFLSQPRKKPATPRPGDHELRAYAAQGLRPGQIARLTGCSHQRISEPHLRHQADSRRRGIHTRRTPGLNNSRPNRRRRPRRHRVRNPRNRRGNATVVRSDREEWHSRLHHCDDAMITGLLRGGHLALVNQAAKHAESRELFERDLLIQFLVLMRRWVADERNANQTELQRSPLASLDGFAGRVDRNPQPCSGCSSRTRCAW